MNPIAHAVEAFYAPDGNPVATVLAERGIATLSRTLRGDPAARLHAIGRELGLPLGLSALGMPEDGLALAAEQAAATPYPNPVPLDRDGILALLGQAYSGVTPG